MIQPLRIAFEVACTPDHAFETWTRRATSWWPPEHTVSHQAGAQIVFEPRVGGRIFERTSEGTEIDWGRVTEWDPPRRIRYSWHIATDPTNATDVSIAFLQAPRGTRIEIEHAGWDRLGKVGRAWREANQAGWDGVLPAYEEAARGTAA